MSDGEKSIGERIWIIFSGILLVTAAVFLWRNNLSAAFVAAALGACAWFLSYRAQLRRKTQDATDSAETGVGDESDEK